MGKSITQLITALLTGVIQDSVDRAVTNGINKGKEIARWVALLIFSCCVFAISFFIFLTSFFFTLYPQDYLPVDLVNMMLWCNLALSVIGFFALTFATRKKIQIEQAPPSPAVDPTLIIVDLATQAAEFIEKRWFNHQESRRMDDLEASIKSLAEAVAAMNTDSSDSKKADNK